MAKTQNCCECRNGEIVQPAVALYAGKKWNRDETRKIPWKGWLCADHAEMLADDEAELRVVARQAVS